MKEIYLKEILFKEVDKFRGKYSPENLYTNKEIEDSPALESIISAMKEACKQTLELAAETAYIQDWYMDGKLVGKAVNKQSILELINQIK